MDERLWLLRYEELAGCSEDLVKHSGCEAPGKGVLLTRVIRAQEGHPVPKIGSGAMGKSRQGCGQRKAQFFSSFQKSCKGHLPQSDDDPDFIKELNLLQQVGPAVDLFLERGLVLRRSAANDGRDVAVLKSEAIPAVFGSRLVCKLKPVESSVEPVSAAVSGEQPSRAVSPVRRRCQAHHQEAGPGITKSR